MRFSKRKRDGITEHEIQLNAIKDEMSVSSDAHYVNLRGAPEEEQDCLTKFFAANSKDDQIVLNSCLDDPQLEVS